MNKISIAHDFSKYPGGRYSSDSKNSGEKFRDGVLIPRLKDNEHLEIDLDGTAGYGSSFLEEVFGGLIRKGYTKQELLKKIKIHSSQDSYLTEINEYINDAEKNYAS